MTKQHVDAVIFDLGGVLIDWNPRYLYRKIFAGDDHAMDRFLSEICTPAWNIQQDAGRPLAEATRILCAQYPDKKPLIEAFYDRWDEMLNGPLDESVQILAELKQRGVPIFALTNWSAETFPIALKRYDFLSWFQDIIVSGTERLIKPDTAIFNLAKSRFGVTPQRTLFIDDHPDNVTGAEKAGFVTHHFRNADLLRSTLRQLGL